MIAMTNRRMRNKKQIFIILLLLTCLFSSMALAKRNVVDALLNPVAGLNVAGTYDRHSTVIDFFLYLILFVGVAQSKLAKRFKGRGGRAVVIAVGLILAIALSNSPFTIKKMWPVAAAILISLIVIIVFLILNKIIRSHAVSLSISFITSYFIVRSIFPEYFKPLQNEWASLLHGLFYVAVLILIFRIPRTVFPANEKRIKDLTEKLDTEEKSFNKNLFTRGQRKDRVAKKSGRFSKEEEIAKMLERITKKEEKEGKQIIQDLQDIRSVIEQYGNNREAGKLISKKIKDILPKKHDMEIKLVYIREITARLEQFDISLFANLKDSYGNLPDQEKKIVREEIEQEMEKLKAEKEIITQLTPLMEQYSHKMEQFLSSAINKLREGDRRRAIEWLQEAIAYEKGINDLAQKTGSLERLIRRITEKEFKNLKRS